VEVVAQRPSRASIRLSGLNVDHAQQLGLDAALPPLAPVPRRKKRRWQRSSRPRASAL
jgi:hypothetical protein